MIQALKKRLIILLMALLSLVFLLILLAINWQNYSFNMRQSRRMLADTIEAVGIDAFCQSPPKDPRLTDLNYSVVKASRDGSFLLLSDYLGNPSRLLKISKEAMASGNYRGRNHALVFVREDLQNGESLLFFLGNDYALENCKNLILFSAIFGILGLVLLFFISVYLSRWLVAPVVNTFEAQHQFISDASHELKTPLTIISANTDLLRTQLPLDKHLGYIRTETNRMSTLVNNLLTLARMDTQKSHSNHGAFSFTSAVLSVVLPFESVAYERGALLETDIAPDISFWGDKSQIQQLVSILVDNAICHTSGAGQVLVHARYHHKKLFLSVSNTGTPIPEEERTKIFQRFYRSDKSRNMQEQRYGLGLAIAKSITEKHGGKITVDYKDGCTIFLVIFPSHKAA